jgi:hypothetical protein
MMRVLDKYVFLAASARKPTVKLWQNIVRPASMAFRNFEKGLPFSIVPLVQSAAVEQHENPL